MGTIDIGYFGERKQLSTEFPWFSYVVVNIYTLVLKLGKSFAFHGNETNIKHTIDETVQLNRFSLR